MPQGKHRAGYRKPRTGEKRRAQQPFKIDRLPEAIKQKVIAARAKFTPYSEVAEMVSKMSGQSVSTDAVQRWYDVRVRQMNERALAQAESARVLAEKFAELGFEKLPEATMNALSGEVFTLTNSKDSAERQAAISNLAFLLSKVIDAQSKKKRAEIEERKVDLAQKKFEQLKSKADKATREAAEKLGKGKDLTIADINSIRWKVFGLGPAPGTSA